MTYTPPPTTTLTRSPSPEVERTAPRTSAVGKRVLPSTWPSERTAVSWAEGSSATTPRAVPASACTSRDATRVGSPSAPRSQRLEASVSEERCATQSRPAASYAPTVMPLARQVRRGRSSPGPHSTSRSGAQAASRAPSRLTAKPVRSFSTDSTQPLSAPKDGSAAGDTARYGRLVTDRYTISANAPVNPTVPTSDHGERAARRRGTRGTGA